MSLLIRAVAHSDLSLDDLMRLRALFDGEYAQDLGDWDPKQPYGYAPHDMHVMARDDDVVVGHVGWGRREITVGERIVVVAGVGGVLVSERARGTRLGARLMSEAVTSMRDVGGIDFGYLGCREEVVPFYRSCGWTRVVAAEQSLDRAGMPATDLPGQPILVFPVDASTEWPSGKVDLRGRAW